MRVMWPIVSCVSMFLLGAFGSSRAACETYAIAATNVTMPASGNGESQFTVTGIPETGTIVLSCGLMSANPVGNLPVCPLTPPIAYPVTAGGTLKGSITFYPAGAPVPASVPAAVLAVGAALLLGVRRRMRRYVMLLCALAVLAGVGACGDKNRIVMPPGTYPYSIGASNCPAAGEGPCFLTSTTIMVTVP